MKNTVSSILLAVVAAVTLLSCEHIIDLDIANAPERYVIEGNLTDSPGEALVYLSRTTAFTQPGTFNGISDALVTISGDDITETVLSEVYPGVYHHPVLKGNFNNTYHLSVSIDGEHFTSSCKMPPLVVLDSVFAGVVTSFDGPGLYSHVMFNDPVGMGNYYRIKEFRNNIYTGSITILDDALFDGNTVIKYLEDGRYDDDMELGDSVSIEFQTINRDIYRYWFSIRSAANEIENNSAPANPISNINGGALGYFSTHTKQVKSFVVQ